MSVETTTIEDLGLELGEAITGIPEYGAFEEAKAAVEDSEEAQELISEFNQLRQEFMLAQKVGEATNEDVQKVQQAQQNLHDLPIMDDYLEAQDDLAARLNEISGRYSVMRDEFYVPRPFEVRFQSQRNRQGGSEDEVPDALRERAGTRP